ncbi:hypothetical protein TNCT_142161 [Trichonephila clavata]|uniref:Uncharacterized protein n=1 Tax=Trichonephila clavata TaxID=2740835 RepID=A0A8X6L7C2_TRICU|nr:hypothetical protein TNCT_142161 [Trichonephila clavata]
MSIKNDYFVEPVIDEEIEVDLPFPQTNLSSEGTAGDVASASEVAPQSNDIESSIERISTDVTHAPTSGADTDESFASNPEQPLIPSEPRGRDWERFWNFAKKAKFLSVLSFGKITRNVSLKFREF